MPLGSVVATLTAGLAAAGTLAAAGPVHADSPPSHACSSSVSIEAYSDALDKTTYDGTFVGNLSGLAVDRDGSLLAVSDRSSLFTAEQPRPNPLLDNIEGMTVTGQRRPGGLLNVLLVSDDNQNAVQTTWFYSLRVRVA